MKQILTFNIHSMVDVITNSSTESFACSTAKSIDVVKEQLKMMLDVFVKCCAKEDLDYVSYQGYGYDEVFGDVYILTQEKFDSYSTEWLENHISKDNIGKVIIIGASNNSIPYSLFDMIEEAFNAQRYHLG